MNTLSRRLHNTCLSYRDALANATDPQEVMLLLETVCNDVIKALSHEALIDKESVVSEAGAKVKELPECHDFPWTFHDIRFNGAELGAGYTHGKMAAVYEAKLEVLSRALKNIVEGLYTIHADPDMDAPAIAEELIKLYEPLLSSAKPVEPPHPSVAVEAECPYMEDHTYGTACPVCGKE